MQCDEMMNGAKQHQNDSPTKLGTFSSNENNEHGAVTGSNLI